MADPSQLRLRLPAVLVYLWVPSEPPGLAELISAELEKVPLLRQLRPNLLALVPGANQPGEIGEAVGHCRRLLAMLQRNLQSGSEEVAGAPPLLGALVLPGEVELAGEEIRAGADPLLEDIVRKPPAIDVSGVYLTGHAASRVSGLFDLKPNGNYEGASGRTAPLFRFVSSKRDIHPWKNPNLLGRELAYVKRPMVEKRLLALRTQAVLRVSGPLGCGKTRTVWTSLGSERCREKIQGLPDAATAWIWIFARSRGSSSGSFGRRLLNHLVMAAADFDSERAERRTAENLGLGDWAPWVLDELLEDPAPTPEHLLEMTIGALAAYREEFASPLRLIFDGLEAAPAQEMEFLDQLLAQELPEGIYFVLVGRPSTAWPIEALGAPRIDVPFLQPSEMEALGENLFQGLSMPVEIQETLIESSGGSPFALEEGVVRMVHRKRLRRVYGSFFFSGSDGETAYEPSPRLVQHLEGEASSLGNPAGMRLLALARQPVPAKELATAAALMGHELVPHWETPYLSAGWVSSALSPWGPGLQFTCSAYARAMAQTVSEGAVQQARQHLGGILSHSSDRPEARWHAYELLSGSSEAISPILELARAGEDGLPQDQLLESLTRELSSHQKRDGDTATELQLLWVLLPLARRIGQLQSYGPEMDRALDLAKSEPQKLLAFASLKAEVDVEKGNLEEGERTLRSALELALDGNAERQALVLIQLGRLLVRQERHREAQTLFEQLLPALEKRGSDALVASCLFYLGNIALAQNRLDEALSRHQHALDIRKQKARKSQGMSWSAVGAVYLALGEYPRAFEHYEKAQELLEKFGDDGDLSYALVGIGRTLGRMGDYVGASSPLRQALELREKKPDVVGEAIARLALAVNHLDLGRPNAALEEARKTHFRLSLLGSEINLLGHTEQALGRIHLALRNLDDAQKHFDAALAIHLRRKDEVSAAADRTWLLEIALHRDEAGEIQRLSQLLDRVWPILQKSDRAETLKFRLFRGFERLEGLGMEDIDPLPYLRSCFAELMRKAEHLNPEQRHRFLFQIPEHSSILDAATRNRLTMPG